VTLKAIKTFYGVSNVDYKGRVISKTFPLLIKGRRYIVNEQSFTLHVCRHLRGVLYLNDLEMKEYFGYIRPYSQADYAESLKNLEK